jgi:glutamate-ammonia-ligase adenylyltransferase
VAAAEISGNLTVELVSNYLTAIADTLMRRAIASDYLMQRHGQPFCVDDGKNRQAALCVVAYGKAGGIELSYSSDLNIVFLHDSRGAQQFTNGGLKLWGNFGVQDRSGCVLRTITFKRCVGRTLHYYA